MSIEDNLKTLLNQIISSSLMDTWHNTMVYTYDGNDELLNLCSKLPLLTVIDNPAEYTNTDFYFMADTYVVIFEKTHGRVRMLFVNMLKNRICWDNIDVPIPALLLSTDCVITPVSDIYEYYNNRDYKEITRISMFKIPVDVMYNMWESFQDTLIKISDQL